MANLFSALRKSENSAFRIAESILLQKRGGYKWQTDTYKTA